MDDERTDRRDAGGEATTGPRYRVERRDDRWAVVSADGSVVATADLEASANAERARLMERDDPHADTGEGSPDAIGARPGQVGS